MRGDVNQRSGVVVDGKHFNAFRVFSRVVLAAASMDIAKRKECGREIGRIVAYVHVVDGG